MGGGGHSPSGKRRRKDRTGVRGEGAAFLSPGLHPLLFSSGWGPTCISVSLRVQPVDGLSKGPIKVLLSVIRKVAYGIQIVAAYLESSFTVHIQIQNVQMLSQQFCFYECRQQRCLDRRDINGQGSSPPHCVQWGTIGNNLNVSHYGHGEIWALLYTPIRV